MHLTDASTGPTGSLVGCTVLQELHGWAGKFTFFNSHSLNLFNTDGL